MLYLTKQQNSALEPQNRANYSINQKKMAGKDQDIKADFTSYYLQQSTKEFAEDLDKIRSADDFKGDALPMLINSLQQGTSMFSAADQRRIVDARQASNASKSADSEEEST
ncbi:ribosome-assembly protein 3-domain-containing protein [Xylaria longipes]|nr:ribosome-assembly protein 3-domain-containing protein [Xylaria longipes]